MRRPHRAALLALGLALSPGVARGDLVSDADAVSAHLAGLGLSVTRGESIFVEPGLRGDAAAWLRAAASLSSGVGRGCTTLVLVAPRVASFSAEVERAEPSDEPPAKSEAGLLVLARCGPARAELARVRVKHATRGAVEVLWASGADAVSSVADALPERAPGPGRLPRELLPPPPAEPAFAARKQRAERRVREGGAERVQTLEARASDAGKGELLVQLEPGCHRLDVVASGAGHGGRVDVDAEVHLDDRLITKDRGEAVDAALELCVARTEAVVLSYLGAPPVAEVAIVVGRWALPKGPPASLGPVAHAALARTLWKRGQRALPVRPVAEVLAVHGETKVPVQVVPGRCYVVGAAALEPGLRILRLDVAGLRGPHRDETLSDASAAVVAFCAEEEETVTLELDARGAWASAVVWALE